MICDLVAELLILIGLRCPTPVVANLTIVDYFLLASRRIFATSDPATRWCHCSGAGAFASALCRRDLFVSRLVGLPRVPGNPGGSHTYIPYRVPRPFSPEALTRIALQCNICWLEYQCPQILITDRLLLCSVAREIGQYFKSYQHL